MCSTACAGSRRAAYTRPSRRWAASLMSGGDNVRATACIERICDGAPAGTVDVGLDVETSG